jgi:hypothetical protein
MAGIATDATGISSLQSGLETPDVALNLRKQGDSIVSACVVVLSQQCLCGTHLSKLSLCTLLCRGFVQLSS